MKFKVGNIINDKETNEKIIEIEDYVLILEDVLKQTNLYCKPIDLEAERCISKIREFCKENNRLNTWWD